MVQIRLLLFVFLLIALSNCGADHSDLLFKKLPASKTGISFINQLSYTDSLSVLEFEYMFNGAGVALSDFNNDGLLDVFFTGNIVTSRLYLNKGNFTFEDVTEKAGLKTGVWCSGVSVVDINQDGFQDIYISVAGSRNTPAEKMRNLFFINNGVTATSKGDDRGGLVTFTEAAASMKLDDDGYDVQSAFFDYDKDGDLDMYLLRNALVNYNRNTARPRQMDGMSPSNDKLFRNNGPSSSISAKGSGVVTFTDVSQEAGIAIEGFGLGVAVCDINNDDWPDIYASNDFLTNDHVYINNQNGTFTNKAGQMLRHQTYNGMGNDVADFNNDGYEDIMVVDMLPPDNKRWKLTMRGNHYDEFQQNIAFGYEPQYVRNTLQLNNGDGSFSEIGQLAGVHATEWSWAPLFADYDNDGWKDLFVTNGYRQDVTNLDFIMYGKRSMMMGTPEAHRTNRLEMLHQLPGIKVHNYVFKNNGNFIFNDVSKQWGLQEPGFSNGAAYGDLDNDGDLDLVINNIDQIASVYENQSNNNSPDQKWIRTNFKGPHGNRDGIGAKVWIWQNGQPQYNYFSPYRGYLSTVEPLLHFGLRNRPVDSLQIMWPDGSVQLIQNPVTNKILTLEHKDAHNKKNLSDTRVTSLFTKADSLYQISYLHKEDGYVDFKTQPLLPHMHSRNGPGLAVGDINGDNLDDFFIGAAAGYEGSIFIQQKNKTFQEQPLQHRNTSDEMGALFFDADNDGDNDLYVVSGGTTAHKTGHPFYQHRLLINDGTGNLTLSLQALPAINSSGSCVIASDFDHDDDLDLFVGGRISPGEYPFAPRSFLLRNDSENGQSRFTDVTMQTCAALYEPGMVTAALWTDFDNDGWCDLIVTGEFMPIRFFKNTQGKLHEITRKTGLEHTAGWWNSLVAGDFDKDGDMDYVAGNLGLNSWLKASPGKPVCVYGKDFDKNGRVDPILCHYVDGKEYMIHARDDMSKQINATRGRFKDYNAYATVTFENAFRGDEVADALILKSERFESSYIENKGGGKFVIRDLPVQAQFAPIFGMMCEDINRDGNLDVLSVGNAFSTEVQIGRYDAQGSLLLLGDGKGNFVADRKRFNIEGDNKSFSMLYAADSTSLVLIGTNSGKLKAFQLNTELEQIALLPADVYAVITDRNGKNYKQEFYYGDTYLSQRSRRLSIPVGTRAVNIYDCRNNKRTFTF